MLTVELPDRTLLIKFRHPDVERLAPLKGFRSKLVMKRRSSEVDILQVETGKEPRLLSKGIVSTHYKDNFSRETGRKRALASALTKTDLTKFERGMVWAAYHCRAVDSLMAQFEHQLRMEKQGGSEPPETVH